VVETLKAVVNQPTKAAMIATMEHYDVLEFGRDQAKKSRESNATSHPRQKGLISSTVVTFLNNILAEVKG
jgi:hypothetical protein